MIIPSEFIDRFVYQYDRRFTFYSSLKAYDEWFLKYYTRYDIFIKGMKKELEDKEDYQISPPAGGDDRSDKRTVYLIRFEALQ